MFIDMLHHANFKQYDMSSLITGVMGGSPCPRETMKQAIEKMYMKKVTVSWKDNSDFLDVNSAEVQTWKMWQKVS